MVLDVGSRTIVPAVMLAAAVWFGPRSLAAGSKEAPGEPAAKASLSEADVCELVLQTIRQESVERPGSSLLDQPCTQKLAGVGDRIAIDVGLSEGPAYSNGRRPLRHGETCGTREIIVACDGGKSRSRCSSDRKEDEHWKLVVGLNVRTDGRVAAWATVLPYKGRPPAHGVVSPCYDRKAVYEKVGATWRPTTPPKP